MAPMLVSPDPGGDDHVSGLQQGLRLSDAEEIAAERLDGAAEGSLKEALAIAPAEDASNAARPQLADPVGAVDESFAAGPLVRLIDAQFAEAGPHAHSRAAVCIQSSCPGLRCWTWELRSPRRPTVLPRRLSPLRRLRKAEEPASASTEDRQGFVGDVPPASAARACAGHGGAAGHGASGQRARCRRPAGGRRQRRGRSAGEPETTAGAQAAAREPASATRCRPGARSSLRQRRGVCCHGGRAAAPALPPLPLPLHAASDTGGELAPAMLPPSSRRRPLPERRGLDVRGFLAGFALSWAFGVVLYLFITAG